MTFSHNLYIKTRTLVLACFIILLVPVGRPSISTAADIDRETFQEILRDSLEALWTGQEVSPALMRRQQALKTMLATGEVKKAELEGMMEAAFFAIMDHRETSRYSLKTFPERANALFSPHMAWEEVKEVLWRAFSSAIKKEAPVVIKVGTLAPPGTPWLNVPETIVFPEIERLSAGKILIKIYGGGVMGEDTEILEKMDDGRLDCCGCTALGVLAACPEASALLLPNLFKNYEEVDYICEKFRKRLDESFEQQGYILWAIIDTGFFYIFSANKITGLEDIKKQKVITWFGVTETTLFQELKINATPIAVPDIVSSLNTGLADINIAPAAWMLGMQAYQYSNFYLKPPLFYSPAAVIVSAQTTDRIQRQIGKSKTFAHNIQEILVSEWNAAEPEWKRQIRSYEEKSLKAFETKCGMKSVTFPAEDLLVIEKASKAVQQKLAGKVFPKDLIDDIQKALEAYRAAP